MQLDKIFILDFGSQTTQLIARKVRECGVFSEVKPYNITAEEIKQDMPKGIILSGGPASVYNEGCPMCDMEIFELGIPIFTICYGMQIVCHEFGGAVERSAKREYGYAKLKTSESPIFEGLPETLDIWMNHSDKVTAIPEGFTVIGSTENTHYAAICNKKNIFCTQFHPEVTHTKSGKKMIENFVIKVCQAKPNWCMKNFVDTKVEEIQATVKDSDVICAISGGVDSTVIATLIHKAIGKQLHCIFVNTGLLRENEVNNVIELLKDSGLDIKVVDAKEIFFNSLQGVTDPEQKRKIIGKTFIDIFSEEAKSIPNVKFLAQGTLYPDIIESTPGAGAQSPVKSHHNVGGLPDHLPFELLEPAKELFKDEVRELGLELNLSFETIARHPFPGPGLAVRILGEITEEKLEIAKHSDAILIEEIKKRNLYHDIWQAFTVVLPIKTVGIKGDERSYEHVVAIRLVNSIDGMTANSYNMDMNILFQISNRITNEVDHVNRVVYDISSKPPSTIEWE